MKKVMVVAALAALPSLANAQDMGIALCDTFYRQYEACVSSRIPEAQRPAFRDAIEQTRSGLRQLATDPQARPQVENLCQLHKTQMTQALAAYGCTFN